MSEYSPTDDRPLDLDWQDSGREGQVWVSDPVATATLADGPVDIRLAIKQDGDDWVFWAEQWTDDEPLESISNTTYAADNVDEMTSALAVIRSSLVDTLGREEE